MVKPETLDRSALLPKFCQIVSRGRFKNPPHIRLMTDRLMRLANREIFRDAVSAPPRHGKSQLRTIYFGAWYILNNPDHRVVVACNAASLATQFTRAIRDIVEEYGDIYGLRVRDDVASKGDWRIDKHEGGVYAVGIGGSLSGRGADLLILDDPINDAAEALSETVRESQWDWYASVADNRLEPNAIMSLTMCMVGDTPVLMADGTETPIKNIRPGDRVATYDEGRISASKVVNWKHQGCDDIYEIRMESGRIVRANERHPFLVETDGSARWIRLRDLMVGDGIVAVTPKRGRCAGSLAPAMSATCPPRPRGFARVITKRFVGRMASALLRAILNLAETFVSSNGTGLRGLSTTLLSSLRTASVRSVGYLPPPTFGLIGAENSPSTTITSREKSGDCFATTAISWSVTERRRKSCSEALDTYGITPDRIVGISAAGREDVFDIQVEGTENFIANGLVSHNTRWHDDDLLGRIKEREPEQWDILNIPLLAEEDDVLGRQPGEPLWPERYPLAKIEAKRARDPFWFDAMQQGRPRPKGGGMFKTEWFKGKIIRADQVPPFARRVRHWDFAASEGKGDWTVGTHMAAVPGAWFIQDVERFREGPFLSDQRIKKVADRDAWEFGQVLQSGEQEPGSSGKKQAAAFAILLRGHAVQSERPTGPKPVRAAAFASQCQAGNVYLVDDAYSDHRWNAHFIKELCEFPTGKQDDCVDSASGAFNELLDVGVAGEFVTDGRDVAGPRILSMTEFSGGVVVA